MPCGMIQLLATRILSQCGRDEHYIFEREMVTVGRGMHNENGKVRGEGNCY